MQKGPRGGGDRDQIVRHILGEEQHYWTSKVGVRTPQDVVVTDDEGLNRWRGGYCAAIRTFHVEGRLARIWPLRFLIRHTAYHATDHVRPERRSESLPS